MITRPYDPSAPYAPFASGFYLIDKPAGPTSHDIVDAVRRITGEQRVGHAGTLDPFATGLLIVAVGREATKQMSKLSGLNKEYEAEFVLGELRDTDDLTGKTMSDSVAAGFSLRANVERTLPPEADPPSAEKGAATEEKIKSLMKQFVGEIEQMPPAYAAVKVGGKKMYEAARKGQRLVVKPRKIHIYKFELLDEDATEPPLNPPLSAIGGSAYGGGRGENVTIRVRIACSSGTYIRAIARDMGGYVQKLRRTKIGPFTVAQAYTLESIKKEPQKTLLPALDIFATLAK